MTRHPHQAIPLALSIALALVLAACNSSIPVVSFDPSSSCTTDGRMPGAYPDLERLLPTAYQGHPPLNVDSGRSCTPQALGSLTQDGIDGVRFAGATWALGGSKGLTVAVFSGDGLDATRMLDFYVQGAEADSHTDKQSTSLVTVGDQPGHRLDVLVNNGGGHTIVTWPGPEPGTVFVLLASDLGDAAVAAELDALAAP